MKQTLNIFVKDVRMFSLEIVASLAVMVLFVRLYPLTWGGGDADSRALMFVAGAMIVLVPVSWWVLITRVVHGESLVGERQFWLTRPYQWPKLLAAKALFVAAFVYLPFFVAQCCLLKAAGMHPLAYLPGLFYSLLLTTGIVVLPIAALASVTSSFVKMLLGLLLIAIFWAAAAYTSTLLPTASSSGSSFVNRIAFLGPFCLFVAVIVIQYAKRRTAIARSLLAAVALVLGLLALFGPENFGIRMEYPKAAWQTQGVQIAFRPMVESGHAGIYGGGGVLDYGREVTMYLPLTVYGVAPETALKADDVRVKIIGANGDSWESHWQGMYRTWQPGVTNDSVPVKINRAFYERMKNSQVTVEMSLALTALRAGNVMRMVLPEGPFTILGGSVCKRQETLLGGVSCLSPLRQPPLMLVGARFSKEQCSSEAPSNDGDAGQGWIGNLDTEPAEFGITPVWNSSVYLGGVIATESSAYQHLCVGSPMSFVPYTVAGRRRETVVSGPVVLKSFVPEPNIYQFNR